MSSYGEKTGEKTVNRSRQLQDYTEETKVKQRSMDVPFLLLTLLILGIGVIMVLSASFARAYYETGNATYVFVRQAIFAGSGIVIMLCVSRFNAAFYRKFSLIIFFGAIGMLVLVPVVGTTRGGATRWLGIGDIVTFQPSEIMKVSLILLYSSMICSFKEKMKTFKYGVLPFGAICAVVAGLLMLEPHISACVIVIAITAVMMFAGGTDIKWFGVGLAVVILAGVLVIPRIDYAMARINSWRDPFSDMQGDGYQIVQSLYSIGSGGVLGLGFGQGRQKYLYLPEEHNDFIFSVVCEELGFVGAVLVLILFALLIIRGYWLAIHVRDRYGSLVITGITSLLAIQVFLNVAVATNLIPCTGISLPFFSYGGTALWIQLAEMGMILGISRDIPLRKVKE